MHSREIHLAKRPQGLPSSDCFSLKQIELGPLQEGQLLVRNLWLSVDPYMRGRMMDRKSYIAPFQIDQVLEGGALGEVVESRHPDFQPGDRVNSLMGWREAFVSDGRGLQKLPVSDLPLQSFLAAAGMPGLTAWAGLFRVAQLKAGETVLVSAAAGAVGSMVCQFAKLHGCNVIASVGSQSKVEWLNELGIDKVINYKQVDDLQQALAELAPEGVDVCFENVGGEHLQAALELMKSHGRIVLCGMIDQYNDQSPRPGPENLSQVIIKSLRMEGFIVFDHWEAYPEYLSQLSRLVAEKKISWRTTIHQGIESMPDAFSGLFSGENIGKMLVKI